ncbi:MAG: hypothetical protein JNK54_10565 [Elusimicrobia bacterium]|nr:hypothetical protein [Elusimicrobiota bacterium]
MKYLLPIALLLFTLPASASFSESVTGGRATALDGALTAAPGDVFSLHYNPAGLTDLDTPEAGLFYGRMFKGLSDGSNLSRSFFGWASPTRWGALGLAYGGYSLGNLYNEETLSLGYAHTLGNRFRWGTALKHLKKSVGHNSDTDSAVDPLEGTSFNAEDPTYAESRSASAWDVNLGATWIPTPRWRFGVTGVNLLESDVGLSSSDPVPRVLKAAGSFSSKIGLALLEVSRRRVGAEHQTRLHGGIEKSLGRFALRAGGGMGPNDYKRVSGGFSAKIQILQVDYGFMLPLTGVKDTSGTHQVSVIMRFGQRTSDE